MTWEKSRNEKKENSLAKAECDEWMNEMSLCHVMCNMTTLAVDANKIKKKTARFLDVILQ